MSSRDQLEVSTQQSIYGEASTSHRTSVRVPRRHAAHAATRGEIAEVRMDLAAHGTRRPCGNFASLTTSHVAGVDVAQSLVNPREDRLSARAGDHTAAELREAAVVSRLQRLPLLALHSDQVLQSQRRELERPPTPTAKPDKIIELVLGNRAVLRELQNRRPPPGELSLRECGLNPVALAVRIAKVASEHGGQ
eukprot:5079669-Prymnesium_polylepis.1